MRGELRKYSDSSAQVGFGISNSALSHSAVPARRGRRSGLQLGRWRFRKKVGIPRGIKGMLEVAPDQLVVTNGAKVIADLRLIVEGWWVISGTTGLSLIIFQAIASSSSRLLLCSFTR
jgi:hypothetical protein